MKTVLKTLVINDLKAIFRDPMSFALILLPLLLATLFRFLIPWGTDTLMPHIDLSGMDGIWLGFLLIAGPSMFGWVGGFLLLDEKDQGLLPVLTVTPVPGSLRLLVKSAIPVIISMPSTFLIIWLSGLAPAYLSRYWPVAIMAALQAPMMTLLLSSIGKTKVQGVTLAKSLMLLFMPPMALPFVDHPLIHLTAISPPYWIIESLRTAINGQGIYWFYVTGGIAYTLGIGILLFKLARKRALAA